jgi:proteasome lid subunit RPN8/RPN11
MRISRADYDALIAHARDEAPKECCGYGRIRDGRIEEVFRAENKFASPTRFEMDFRSALAANELEDEGYGVVAYHSHPRSPAEPSQQDRNVNQYPNWLQIIVSLEGEPVARAWWIVDGDAREETLDVE